MLRRRLRPTLATLAVFVTALRVHAQAVPSDADSASRTVRALDRDRGVWAVSSVMLAASFTFDERLRAIALANHSRQVDRVAAGADVLGTAGHIVPALLATYLGARVSGKQSFARLVLRVGASYAAADAVEALLKPAVGRARPYNGHEPLTFRPFSGSGDYQSFPSAHVVHIASLASAIAMEANRPWVTALAGVATTYVGAQRVYRDQHWSSDVVASAMLGVEVARAARAWLVAREKYSQP